MSRINLHDGIFKIIAEISDGNPGACTCIAEMLQKKDWHGGTDPLLMVLIFDQIEIYGEKIYMLWNDCCGRSLTKLELVLKNYQYGKLSAQTIRNHIDLNYGVPFENLIPLDGLYFRPFGKEKFDAFNENATKNGTKINTDIETITGKELDNEATT